MRTQESSLRRKLHCFTSTFQHVSKAVLHHHCFLNVHSFTQTNWYWELPEMEVSLWCNLKGSVAPPFGRIYTVSVEKCLPWTGPSSPNCPPLLLCEDKEDVLEQCIGPGKGKRKRKGKDSFPLIPTAGRPSCSAWGPHKGSQEWLRRWHQHKSCYTLTWTVPSALTKSCHEEHRDSGPSEGSVLWLH